jgi:hypothetical protein
MKVKISISVLEKDLKVGRLLVCDETNEFEDTYLGGVFEIQQICNQICLG